VLRKTSNKHNNLYSELYENIPSTHILKTIDSALSYYDHNQWSKTEAFAEEYRKRASIEGKSAELKTLHGLSRAKGFGLRSVTIQAKLAAIAVNLKRIATIITANGPCLSSGFAFIRSIASFYLGGIRVFTISRSLA